MRDIISVRWQRQGFHELGDSGGLGIGQTVGSVLRHSKFLSDPHLAAHEVWIQGNRNVAANGAVMRTAAVGLFHFENLEEVAHNTRSYCKCTHFDP